MKIVKFKPRTSGWHELRDDSWTASMAAVLVAKDNTILLRDYAASKGVILDIAPLLAVGLDSFFENTLWTSWASKTGRIPRFSGNADTARGVSYEERVIQHFETRELLMVTREVTAVSRVHSGLLASFDALAPASSDPAVAAPFGFPVEAKCPAYNSRKKMFDSKRAGNLYIRGLPYYWCQVQHQILVAEAPYGWFVAAGVEPDKVTDIEKIVFPIIEKVARDDDFLRAYTAAANFYHQEFVYGCVEPPKLDSDIVLLEQLVEKAAFDRAVHDADHAGAADIYLKVLQQEADIITLRKDLEAKLISIIESVRVTGIDVVVVGGKVMGTYEIKSAVSWQKAAESMAKLAGLTEIPPAVLEACKSKPKEKLKLTEV